MQEVAAVQEPVAAAGGYSQGPAAVAPQAISAQPAVSRRVPHGNMDYGIFQSGYAAPVHSGYVRAARRH